MADAVQPKLVRALHSFTGDNNDELCLNKGDVITITQQLDGGWWEGTFNGTTGWFPSNYVKEIKDGQLPGKPADIVASRRDSMLHYHNVVLQNITETERTFVKELQSLLQLYLRPLQAANVLSASEFSDLSGNLEELAELHQKLLSALDECSKEPLRSQKVGSIFLKTAPSLQTLYNEYCANHPSAATILQTRRDELGRFMESRGAASPGITTLTASLATPLTRLEKYSRLLKELERHTDEGHIDRGDTQRAISIYREIALSSMQIRKQKEMEFEVLNSTIKGWEGEEMSHLGQVLKMGHVQVEAENGESRERLILLFPGILVMLSVSPRMSGYTYQGKLPLTGITVTPLEESENITNAFQLSGSMVDQRVVSCSSTTEQKQWVDALREQAKHAPILRTRTHNHQSSTAAASSRASLRTVPNVKPAYAVHQPYRSCKTTWTMSCLRPCPPLRPPISGARHDGVKSPRAARRMLPASVRRKPVDDTKTLEDDALILKVIEAYCTSARTRQTVNSLLLDNPQMLIAEEEKMIVEEMKGNHTVMEEKSLVDTVYSLRDQVRDLKQEQGKLRKDLEEERRARKRLESLIRKSFKSIMDTAGTVDETSSS